MQGSERAGSSIGPALAGLYSEARFDEGRARPTQLHRRGPTGKYRSDPAVRPTGEQARRGHHGLPGTVHLRLPRSTRPAQLREANETPCRPRKGIGQPPHWPSRGLLWRSRRVGQSGNCRRLHRGASSSQPHPPTADVRCLDEARYFRPATARSMGIQGQRIGLTICEDAWNDKQFWERSRYSRVSGGMPGAASTCSSTFRRPYPWEAQIRLSCSSLATRHKAHSLLTKSRQRQLIFDGSASR